MSKDSQDPKYETLRQYGTLNTAAEAVREAMDKLVRWVHEGSLQLQIGAKYSLREETKAHQDLEGRATQGKLVLIP